MRLDVTAGTDVATMVLFWPSRVEADVRAWKFREQLEWLEEEQGRGRLLRFPCNSDGSYKLALFVDEEPPEAFARFAVDEVDVGPLHVPAEPGWFGGLEGLSARPEQGQHRSAVEPVDIPAGTYRARLAEFDPPEEHREEWIAERLSPEARRACDRLDGLLGCGSLFLLATLGLVVFSGWTGTATILGALAVALFVAGGLQARSPGVRELSGARGAYDEEFASYLLVLERLGER